MTTKKPADDKATMLAAAKTLGITSVTRDNRIDEIRAAINATLGTPDFPGHDQRQKNKATVAVAEAVVLAGPEAVASETGASLAEAGDIPNLSPNGKWQGKKAKIRRMKTGQNDVNGAIFKWNGWPTIIPIGKAVDIAWPILEIIRSCKGMRMEIRQEEDAQDKGRVNNVKSVSYYDKYPFEFMGVTPGTEHLPESAWEYTLDQYVDDFKGFSVRMWRQLCVLWELSDVQCKVQAGISPEEEIAVRRNAIHYALNLPQSPTLEVRLRVRDQKRADIGMESKAA